MSDAPAETPAPVVEKKKTKLPLIIAAAVLGSVLLGAGGYFIGTMGARGDAGEHADAEEGDAGEAEADAAPAKSASKDAKKDGKKKDAKKSKQPVNKDPALYVKLDPPFVVNFEAKGVMRFLQVTIEVMTRDSKTVDQIKLHDPMIRNDLLMLLGNQTFETISSREGKEQLRAEALKAVSKVIGDEGGNAKSVEQLYFTSFVMQ